MTKKLLIPLSLLALAFGVCANSFAANADKNRSSLSIQFEGRIVNSGCELSTNRNGDSIYLGTYPTEYFKNYRSQIETDGVPFELIIRKCSLAQSDQDKHLDAATFPVERVRLTLIDDGSPAAGRERSGIMLTPKGNEVHAENLGVRVKYQRKDDKFASVFAGKRSNALSISSVKYRLTNKEGAPEYRSPLQANMVATGHGPVTQGSVKGRMIVTLSYE